MLSQKAYECVTIIISRKAHLHNRKFIIEKLPDITTLQAEYFSQVSVTDMDDIEKAFTRLGGYLIEIQSKEEEFHLLVDNLQDHTKLTDLV